jgi:hypothetical protein
MQPTKTAEKRNQSAMAGPGMKSDAKAFCLTPGYFAGSRLELGHTK